MALLASKALLSSGPGPEQTPKIGTPDSNKPQVTYKLRLRPGASGVPMPYIVRDKSQPGDGPADFPITEPCVVTLEFDEPNYDCEFRGNNPITFGENDDFPGLRYKNLAVGSVNGRNKFIQFEADFLNDASANGNRDPYNLYFHVYFRGPNGGQVNPPMTIRFDPDIKNPGTDAQGGLGRK